MNTEVLLLKNQLCFPLYAVSREIIQLYKPLLDELEITYPQYLVLMVLWEKDKQTVNQIGEKLLLDSGTLTPLLKRLEQKGLVNRNRSLVDERTVEISLTDKGFNIKEKAECIPSKIVKQVSLSTEEVQSLKYILNKILSQTIK
uniref:MarR family winged helix-turn-helix transcriptional regulator n=1 Tax=Flavobacterium sp. TaxID=239 RepID=UPI00404B39FC